MYVISLADKDNWASNFARKNQDSSTDEMILMICLEKSFVLNMGECN